LSCRNRVNPRPSISCNIPSRDKATPGVKPVDEYQFDSDQSEEEKNYSKQILIFSVKYMYLKFS
jgi:hypothetical protein